VRVSPRRKPDDEFEGYAAARETAATQEKAIADRWQQYFETRPGSVEAAELLNAILNRRPAETTTPERKAS